MLPRGFWYTVMVWFVWAVKRKRYDTDNQTERRFFRQVFYSILIIVIISFKLPVEVKTRSIIARLWPQEKRDLEVKTTSGGNTQSCQRTNYSITNILRYSM